MIAIGRTKPLLLLTALAALGTAPAGAQQGRTAMRTASAQIITWPQFLDLELQWFNDVDSNHDGTINVHDYRAWMRARYASTVPLVALTSPTVTRRAFVAALRRQFDALDTNHDGVLSVRELRAGTPLVRTFTFGVPDGEAF